jgi:hypothetical protein
MQTGILVLLIVLVSIVCFSLFFTNKEVRNIKTDVVKSRHDITAIQTLLNNVGLSASGKILEDDEEFIDPQNNNPQSNFMNVPQNISMFPPNMISPNSKPTMKQNNSGNTVESLKNNNPDPLPADTKSEPANLNLKETSEHKDNNVIPMEDVELVNSDNKSQESPKKENTNTAQDSSSDDETDSDEESETDEE